MPPTLYRSTGYALSHLVEEIKHGTLALPDIQRPFVWKSSKARDLFDSMYRGYPVGTLMFWETGAEVGTRQIGGGEADRVARLLIVDGQQRVTSLYAVLTGTPVLSKKFEKTTISIAFNPITEKFEVTDAAIRKNPEFIADITTLWEGGYKTVVREFFRNLGESRGEEVGHEEQDDLEEKIDRVRDLRDFPFQVVELSANANEEQVADIFVRINSEGVQLNQADFILTLMSVHWEKGRRQLEEFARTAVDPTVKGPSSKNPFIDPRPDQMLRASIGLAFRRGRLQHVYSLLRGKDLETGEVSKGRREQQFEQLDRAFGEALDLTNWHEFLKCITHAGFRVRRMMISDNTIIYSYVMWLVGRRDFGVDTKTLRGVIARWFFMSTMTGRYTNSPESRIERDLRRLDDLEQGNAEAFTNELDRTVRATFTNDYWDITLPTWLDSSSANTPVLYGYWAALSLLDAELLFSEMRVRDMLDPATVTPKSIERHHLFPKKYLNGLGITGRRQQNAIANMAFLDWPENIKIGGDSPLDYWPQMVDAIDADRLAKQRYWHALPIGWEQLDYEDFLEKRRKLIGEVTREGFERLWEDKPAEVPGGIAELIEAGESQIVEYKSTARWNVRAEMADRKMEHVIVKTVCGFLNADGGSLLVGVEDDGNVIGLGADYGTLGSKGNRDGFELWLRQHLANNLSVETAGLVRVKFDDVGGLDVCTVTVPPSGKPVFAKPHEGKGDLTEFWVRDGNRTEQLHGDQMVEYQQNHWG